MGCFIINKPFDLGADTDHNPDTGILTEFLPLCDRGNCRNFVGSASLAELCAVSACFQIIIVTVENLIARLDSVQ